MFLPRISWLPWFLAMSLAAMSLQGCGPRVVAPSAARRIEVAQVVAGSGDVSDAMLDRVRESVATELGPLSRALQGMHADRFFVHVHATREEMPESLRASLHEDSPGFAVLGRHQIHLVLGEMRRTGASLRGVVVHELTHELLDQLVAPNGDQIPRWFHEGLAQLMAGDTYLGASEEDLVWRVGAGRLRPFGSLRSAFPAESSDLRTAYAQSYSYVSWLEHEYGLPLLLRVARSADGLTSFERALVGMTGQTTLQLEDRWLDHLLHGSGATLRGLFDRWFSLLMIAALPVLVLALMRRLRSEERAAQRLAAREAADRAAAEAAAEVAAESGTLPSPDEGDEAERSV